jgi:hypothetical protein
LLCYIPQCIPYFFCSCFDLEDKSLVTKMAC